MDKSKMDSDDWVNGVVAKINLPKFIPSDNKFIETDQTATEEDIKKKEKRIRREIQTN